MSAVRDAAVVYLPAPVRQVPRFPRPRALRAVVPLVAVTRVHPLALAVALRLADGDPSRLRFLVDEGAVLVLNRPRTTP